MGIPYFRRCWRKKVCSFFSFFRAHVSVINRPSSAHVSVELLEGGLLALIVQLFEIVFVDVTSFRLGLDANDLFDGFWITGDTLVWVILG